jgi:hypothetical protein
MLSEHRSAPRRRKNRASRYAVPLAIPVALAAVFGVVIAVSGGNATTVAESALGTCASASASAPASTTAVAAASASAPAPAVAAASASAPAPAAASGSAPAAAASASAAPCPAASASASASAPATTTLALGIPPINGPGRAGAAGSNAVDASGAALSFTQTTTEAADSTNCTVSVPANPLTAAGLATPWELGDGCTWANGGSEGVFIDATILSPTGQLSIYNPLVVDQGTKPEVAPVAPTIPQGSQVILSVGYNGNALALVGPGIRQGNCIDALGNSIINQTPQCNAIPFYQMANREIARGILKIPAAGTAKDGQACQTTRDFTLIDQDQSDNAVAHYLFNPQTGQMSQDTPANQTALTGDTLEANGSDNGLLDLFVDPALGCTPFTAPNPTNPNGASASQALNELAARVNQKGTIALVPVNDPQTLVGGQFNLGKTNLYRAEVDMPQLGNRANLNKNAAQYCQDMINIATPRLKLDADMEVGTASPVPDLGNNLATFLAARLAGSFDNLNCKNYGLTDPITLTTDDNGVATAATYNTTPQKASVNDARGRSHRPNYRHRFMPGRFGHV